MQVTDIHQSGHAPAPADRQAAMLAGVTAAGTVAAITEARTISEHHLIPPGWAGCPGDPESLVIWEDSAWEMLDHGVAHTPTPPWKRGTKIRHNFALTWVLLRSKISGATYLRCVGHLPAHLYRPAEAAAHAAAVAGLGRMLADLKAQHAPDEITASFDFNADLRRAKWQHAFTEAVAGLDLSLVIPPKATHRGGRRIDGFLTTCPTGHRVMLPRFKGMDHRGVRVALSFPDGTPEPPEPPEEDTVPRGYLPGALRKPIAPGANDPEIIPVGVAFHVAVSQADSLHDWFTHDGGIESHFYVRYDGTIEQYRSIFYEADAQSAGNSFGNPRRGFVSVETEGMGEGKWTDAQIAALKTIVLFVHAQSPFALRVAPAYNAEGIGYHCLFPEWNPNAHSCPGPARVRQFHDIFVPWLHEGARPVTPEEDWFDMASKDDLRQIVRDEIRNVGRAPITVTLNEHGAKDDEHQSLNHVLRRLLRGPVDADALAEKVAAKINASLNADAEVVKQAVKDALAEGVEG